MDKYFEEFPENKNSLSYEELEEVLSGEECENKEYKAIFDALREYLEYEGETPATTKYNIWIAADMVYEKLAHIGVIRL